MIFRILGPLEVRAGDRSLDLGGEKQRALLAQLLLEANRVVPRDRLIDGLWEEAPPETAHKAIQVYVSQLRKVLGPERLETRNPGYLLRLEPDELDAACFERLHDEGRPEDALALWRGTPLADLAHLRFAQPDIARLEELRLACIDERITRALEQGRHGELMGELEGLVRAHPLRESLRAHHMLCLYRCGRQAEALEAYQAARAALVEELGIEPDRRLRELQAAILRQDPALDPPGEPGAAAAGRARGAFVGRKPEFAALVTGFVDAVGGNGRLFLIAGEPGIGKSRLTEEIAVHAEAHGAHVLVGRCWEAGGAPAYWPWVQSLRAYARNTDAADLLAEAGDGAAYLAQIVPEFGRRLPELGEPPALDTDGARFRLFDATAQFLRNASARRPLVLVLDDLHAADGSSLLLLRYVAREIASARILLVAAYRDVDPSPAASLKELLAEVAREPSTRRLSLGGLSRDEVAEYVELTASELASPALFTALQDAEGNPLFVGEIVRMIADEARPDDDGALRLAIPQSVRDVIARRLTRLSDECQRVLVLASVLGREFRLDALAALAGVSVDELLETLDEAMTAGVVSELPGGTTRLRFAHVLIRDTLYDDLNTARRVRLHRRAVSSLEELYGPEPGPQLAELAHHAVAGSDFERGVDYARRAGDRALALLAYEEAARQYEAALDALDVAAPDDGPARCELLLAFGQAAARSGDTPTARTSFWEAAKLARGLGHPIELAEAALGYGGRIVWGRAGADQRLVPLLEEALEELPVQERGYRVRLLSRLAGALRDDPVRDRRDRISAEAVQLAREVGDPVGLAHAINGRAATITAPDRIEELRDLADELLALGERHDDREWVVQALSHLDIAQLHAGEVRAARETLERAAQLAEALRQPPEIWLIRGAQAMIAVACGDAGAEELIESARAIGRRTIPEAAEPCALMQRYTLCEFHGRLDEVEDRLIEVAERFPARPLFRCALALLHARLGRTDAAASALAGLVDSVPFEQEWLMSMSLLAETCALVGDQVQAARLYDLLAPWEDLNVVDQAEGIRGSVARCLGLLAGALGRDDDARRHMAAAVERNIRMGLEPWAARARDELEAMTKDEGPARSGPLATM